MNESFHPGVRGSGKCGDNDVVNIAGREPGAFGEPAMRALHRRDPALHAAPTRTAETFELEPAHLSRQR